MNKKIIFTLILSSTLLFSFGCNKDDKPKKNDDTQNEQIVEKEDKKENTEKINPLYDTSNLKKLDTKIFLNNKPLDLSSTISGGPLSNSQGNLLIPFSNAYELLGFNVEKNHSDEDFIVSATNEKFKVYIAINIEKNIKSISINDEDLSGSNTSMYILKDENNDNSELLIPFEFIARSIDSTIVKGNEKNSFVLNFKEDIKEEEIKTPEEEDKINPLFSNIGVEIGDSLDQAKEKFGEVGDSGGYQGSDYYSFDHITIFTGIGTKNITSIGLPNSTYSVDGIKPGDDIKKVYEKYGEKEPEEYEEIYSVIYENIKGYKIEYALKEDKKTIDFITIYEKE